MDEGDDDGRIDGRSELCSQQEFCNSLHAKVRRKTIFHFYVLQFASINVLLIAPLFLCILFHGQRHRKGECDG